MDLSYIFPTRKTGEEKFLHSLPNKEVSLLNFWQWANSDLISNSARGILAEFIVATALGLESSLREEWAPFDLEQADGTKIEIKSSAYIQSWGQKKRSKIIFYINPTLGWNPKTNQYESEPKRQSDIYIFCLHHHQNQETINPLDLSQWTFFLVLTKTIDEQLGKQKSFGLNTLKKLKPIECSFEELKTKIRELKNK